MGAAYLPRHDAATILKVADYSPARHFALALAFVPSGGLLLPFAHTFAHAVPFSSADKLVSLVLPYHAPTTRTCKMVSALSPAFDGNDSFSDAIGSASVFPMLVAQRGNSRILNVLCLFSGELTVAPSGKTIGMTYSVSC